MVALPCRPRRYIDFCDETSATTTRGRAVYMADVWLRRREIHALLKYSQDPAAARRLYANVAAGIPRGDGPADALQRARDMRGKPRSRYLRSLRS